MKAIIVAILLALCAFSFAFEGYSSSRPAPDGSVMKVSFVDKDSGAAIRGSVVVSVQYASSSDGQNYQYTDDVNATSADVALSLPPAQYPATARIKAIAAGYYDSDEITVTSAEYWAKVGGENAGKAGPSTAGVTPNDYISDPVQPAPKTFLLEKAFQLKKNPNYVATPGTGQQGTGNNGSPQGCCLPLFAILLAGGFVFAGKR